MLAGQVDCAPPNWLLSHHIVWHLFGQSSQGRIASVDWFDAAGEVRVVAIRCFLCSRRRGPRLALVLLSFDRQVVVRAAEG